MNFCFFFSYATGDDPEVTRHKRDFFDDLSTAVENHRDYDRASAQVGFLDAEIPTGSEWKPAVGAALMNCRAFVFLQEVAYFTFAERPWCGREWKVFRDRLEEQARTAGLGAECPPLMIPIIWRQTVNLPPPVADIQFKHRELGEMYSDFDLFRLKSRPENNFAYKDFLKKLANYIVHAVKAHPLAPASGLPRFDDIANPFSAAAAPPNGPKIGPRYVDFVYVVAPKAELQPHRTVLESYDDTTGDPCFWMPYYPPDQDMIAQLAEGAAWQQRVMPDRIALGPDLVTKLNRSLQAQRMVVLIVDPWSLMVNACEALMKQFWQSRFWNAVVLVLRQSDEETKRRAKEISDRIDDVFFDWRPEDLRAEIRSREELVTNLQAAFLAIQKKLLKKSTFRAVKGEGMRTLPGLSALGI